MSFPAFDKTVPDHGYRWWYLDAYSDDNRHALTLIAFVGSVFSPYYSWARKHQARTNGAPAVAENYCAINLALYGEKSRWCMTERGQANLQRTANRLAIGPSHLEISDNTLHCAIQEVCMPIPQKLAGRISVALPPFEVAPIPIDSSGEHLWQPIAPRTRIKVEFDKPELSWQGSAYIDSNWGAAPLEDTFRSWTWSRSHKPNGTTRVQYDVIENLVANTRSKTFEFDEHGFDEHDVNEHDQTSQLATETDRAHNKIYRMPSTRYWRIPRETRLSADTTLTELETLEDTPFYSRSRFCTHTALNGTDNSKQSNGEKSHSENSASDGKEICMHESLDLKRFDSRWVRPLLPFRMPRTTRHDLTPIRELRE